MKEFKKSIQTIRSEPDDAKGYFDLGVAYSELGLWLDATEAFQQALRIQTDYVHAHFALAVAYLSLKDIVGAWNEYRIVRNLDENQANELLDLICLAKAHEPK